MVGKRSFLRILTGKIFMNLNADLFDINRSSSLNDHHNCITYLGGEWIRRRIVFEGICPYHQCRNNKLIDTGLVLQLNEQEDNHNGTSRYQEQQGWVDGRLARKRVIASMEQQKKKSK